MTQLVRQRLIEALQSRSWTAQDAELVATRVEKQYQRATGAWKVVLWEVAGGEQSVFLVARNVDGTSVFDSPLQTRAWDVANALNEIETSG